MMHDEVVSRLRHVLTEGEIPPGARIPERELCASFAISRTPLREALKVLAAEGLVVLLPNRGSRAAKLTRKDVKELFEVCEALEAAAGELACPRISDAQLREIADLQANMVEQYRAQDLISYAARTQSAELVFSFGDPMERQDLVEPGHGRSNEALADAWGLACGRLGRRVLGKPPGLCAAFLALGEEVGDEPDRPVARARAFGANDGYALRSQSLDQFKARHHIGRQGDGHQVEFVLAQATHELAPALELRLAAVQAHNNDAGCLHVVQPGKIVQAFDVARARHLLFRRGGAGRSHHTGRPGRQRRLGFQETSPRDSAVGGLRIGRHEDSVAHANLTTLRDSVPSRNATALFPL